MYHRWAALVLVLALCAMMPKHAAGQVSQPRGHSAGKIGRPSKNPFNPDIHIPFTVGDGNCGVNEQHVVSVRILNILAQPVVVPVFEGPAAGSTATASTALNGRPISNLTLGCGDYQMYWDGAINNTGREAPSGVYAVQVLIDGKVAAMVKIYHLK